MHSSQRTDPPFRETSPRIPVPTVAVLALLASMAFSGRAFAQSYHTYPQIESTLAAAEANYPTICRRVSLGTTVQGRTMWALCITDNPGVEEDEPEFRYISTMHGNEIIGMEMCLSLIDYLTVNYGVDSRVTNLVNSVEIWIVPCMNPDGFVAGTRGNAHGTDLNRNFRSFADAKDTNPAYAEVHELLVPAEWPPTEATRAGLAACAAKMGLPAFRAARMSITSALRDA